MLSSPLLILSNSGLKVARSSAKFPLWYLTLVLQQKKDAHEEFGLIKPQ